MTMKIVLENIHKSYAKRVVVNANISVAQGEVVGLLGPNGAGKRRLFLHCNRFRETESG